jgi:hypothetical protein
MDNITKEIKWIFANAEVPKDSSKDNLVWVASRKFQTVSLGYYSKQYNTFFDINGNSIKYSLWAYVEKPLPPPPKKQV